MTIRVKIADDAIVDHNKNLLHSIFNPDVMVSIEGAQGCSSMRKNGLRIEFIRNSTSQKFYSTIPKIVGRHCTDH
jgi:hypothetical protein